MGILSQKICLESQLKENGFTRSNQWGAPYQWGDSTIYWLKRSTIHPSQESYQEYDIRIFYFPDTFDGYVTPFNSGLGIKPAGKVLIVCDSHFQCDQAYESHICDYMDIEVIINDYTKLIKQKMK